MIAAYSTAADRILDQVAFADISALAVDDALVQLPLSVTTFATLRNTNGSLRLRLPGTPTTIPNVIITNMGNNQFAVVEARCTHENQPVNPRNAQGRLVCPTHGSQYSPTGQVIVGPARRDLPSFASAFDARTNLLTVTVPGLGYRISSVQLASANGARLQLTFPSLTGQKYEIRRKLTANGDWLATPFATTPEGALTTNVINGTGQALSVYVERLTEIGFFGVLRVN